MPPTTAIAVTSTRPHCSGKTAGRRGAMVLRLRRRHMPQTVRMEEAFGIVIFAVVAVAAVVAVGTFFTSGKAYDQIGKGGLSLRDGSDRPVGEPQLSGAAADAERDEEIRQMLEARNARRIRRGEEPVDVEVELAALTAARPQADPQLVAEVRQLVEARNARRARKGEPPLDVEAEVERQLRDLGV